MPSKKSQTYFVFWEGLLFFPFVFCSGLRKYTHNLVIIIIIFLKPIEIEELFYKGDPTKRDMS